MYDDTLHHGRKHFYRYCLQELMVAEKLKCHNKDCFIINVKQRLKFQKR